MCAANLCVESINLIYSDRVLSDTVGHRTATEGPTSVGVQIRDRQSLPGTHQGREDNESQHQEREANRKICISGKSSDNSGGDVSLWFVGNN